MHKPLAKIFLLLPGLFLVSACTQTNSSGVPVSARTHHNPEASVSSVPPDKDSDDTCACTFDIIGEIHNGERLDLLISGRGWNPKSYACSYTWGEFIYNEFAPDTVTDFRIHLVDLEKEQVQPDKAFLNSKTFNDNLIATYAKQEGNTNMRCRFDPNRTGKYPKPEHWID
ncbi:MAG: hypothetical protein ACT6QS_06690 [Flavobacteriales bacterium]